MLPRQTSEKTIYIQSTIPIPLSKQLNANVCGPVDPRRGPFWFFIISIDSSTKWSQVSHLSTRNLVLLRILPNIQTFKAQFPQHPIQILRVENAGEFSLKTFDNFCQTAGIETQYPVLTSTSKTALQNPS
jgi:hypothetical protein